MSEPRDDRELEEYLRGDSPLSRRYREASGEEPAPAVDEAILAASRRAVQSRPVRIPRSWFRPLSIAAIVVLSATVVITMQRGEETTVAPAREPARREPDVALKIGDAGRDQATAKEYGKTVPADAAPGEAEMPQAPPEASAARPAAEEALRMERSPALLKSSPPPRSQELAEPLADRPAAVLRAPAADIGLPERREAPRALMREAPPEAAWAPAPPQTRSPEDELKGIAKLWEAGRGELARMQLRRFLAGHPYYPDQDLLAALPPELYAEAERIKGR